MMKDSNATTNFNGMAQEEKDLLLKDLCARLPYSPICHIVGKNGAEIDDILTTSTIQNLDIWVVKPYLRPMSSMTEEEKQKYDHRLECMFYDAMYDDAFAIDWLLANHFDFRGLIEKGLALSTEKYNPYKD